MHYLMQLVTDSSAPYRYPDIPLCPPFTSACLHITWLYIDSWGCVLSWGAGAFIFIWFGFRVFRVWYCSHQSRLFSMLCSGIQPVVREDNLEGT
jgi:hypothetical protein